MPLMHECYLSASWEDARSEDPPACALSRSIQWDDVRREDLVALRWCCWSCALLPLVTVLLTHDLVLQPVLLLASNCIQDRELVING